MLLTFNQPADKYERYSQDAFLSMIGSWFPFVDPQGKTYVGVGILKHAVLSADRKSAQVTVEIDNDILDLFPELKIDITKHEKRNANE